MGKWLQCLPTLENITILRCFKPPGFGSYENVQLHVFSDASESGYGACAYLRIVKENTVSVSLVMGKSRVTPIKHMSIPRLELAAAVVASKLSNFIIAELEVKIDKVVFWTDSTIVLAYINNTSKKFKTFFANKIATIHEYTEPKQWRHVSTSHNPADMASRGINASDANKLRQWLRGPEFLWQDPLELPEYEVSQYEFKNDEVKKTATVAVVVQICILQRFINKYSDWYKLQRATAWLLRYKSFLINKHLRNKTDVEQGDLSVNEIKCAMRHLLSFVQRSNYPDECNRLDKKMDVRTDSTIASHHFTCATSCDFLDH